MRITYRMISILVLMLVLLGFGCSVQVLDLPENPHRYAISNPYEGVDWETVEYHDANFHTHTQLSDGSMSPEEVVDTYRGLGYSILAFTDHNTAHAGRWPSTLFPWTSFEDIATTAGEGPWEDRDPSTLGMIAVEGSEISQNHHIGSWFNDFVGTTEDEEASLDAIASRDGLAIFNHPGRYDRDDSWYVEMFARHPEVIGLEIFNQKDRYPEDRDRWDRILHLTMPERNVWGFGNDDMHSIDNLGWNRNILLVAQLTESEVRASLEGGRFFVFKPYAHQGAPDVRISQVALPNDGIRLSVEGTYSSIYWITYYSEDSESAIIGMGDTFRTARLPLDAHFVRAVIFSEGGKLFTQPFGLERLD